MRKIIIATNNMKIGGIQKSLVELLKALSKRTDIDVYLFCSNQSGELLSRVPKSINILPENKWAKTSELGVSDCRKMGFKYFLFRAFASLWTKIFGKKIPAKLLCSLMGNFGKYDIAVSFSQPIQDKNFSVLTNEIILNCCEASKKITFVHCDFANYGGNTESNRKLYKKFNAVAAVSDSVGRRIESCIPELSGKIHTVYNFCDIEEIKKLSETEPVQYQKKTFITVARLSEEKGIVRCIPIFAKLKKEQAQDFEWHIVGGGPLEEEIRREISNYNLEHTVFLEGQQTNPYRYMKNADFVLLTSFHEAAPIVFDEAIALHIPILTTNTLSANELVTKRHAGKVSENDDESIFKMLKEAITLTGDYNKENILDMNLRMKQFDELCDIEE